MVGVNSDRVESLAAIRRDVIESDLSRVGDRAHELARHQSRNERVERRHVEREQGRARRRKPRDQFMTDLAARARDERYWFTHEKRCSRVTGFPGFPGFTRVPGVQEQANLANSVNLGNCANLVNLNAKAPHPLTPGAARRRPDLPRSADPDT